MGQSVIRNPRKIHSQSGGDPNLITEINNFDKDKNNFRLTLTSGVAVTTSDVVNAQTIYCTPYNGNIISLYNGTNWIPYSSSEFSLALGTLTNNVGYDVFCYANAGVPTLEFLAWTNATTRATALDLQDGILVKSGDATRRFLGGFAHTGNKSGTVTISNASPAVITFTGHNLKANTPMTFTTTGTLPTGINVGTTYYLLSTGIADANTFNISLTPGGAIINTSSAGSGVHTCTVPTFVEDSDINRNLDNYYNQVNRRLFKGLEILTSYNYTTAVARQSNNNTLAQINIFNCVEKYVSLTVQHRVGNSALATQLSAGISLDSTTVIDADAYVPISNPIASATAPNLYTSIFYKPVGIGMHFLASLESSTASGTTTWYRSLFKGNKLG